MESPLPKPDPRAEGAARLLILMACGVTLVAIFFICLVPIAVTDYWWQVKTGELIVRTGRIPTRDIYSWTATGQPWMVHEWLTEVLFYLGQQHLPSGAMLFHKCGLAALACGLVLLRARLRSGTALLGIGAALATASVMRNYADLRPQMITFVLLAGVLHGLDIYARGGAKRLPWVLPFVFMLWANLHGGVVVGLLLLALWVGGEAVGRWWFGRESPGLRALALAFGASCLAAAFNPHGFMVYGYPFQVLGHPEVMDYISEWWSPNLHNAAMRPFELVLLAAFGCAALSPAAGRPRFGELLVLLATAHAALISQRNTVPFAIVATPVIASGLAALWHEAKPLDPLRVWSRAAAVRTAGWMSILLLLIALTASHWPRRPAGQWLDHAIDRDYFPETAVGLMKQGYWPGPMYNDYVWGGYLIWRLHPARQVFVDGRAEVYYPTHAFDDEMRIHNTSPGWLEALDRRGVAVVLTAKAGALANALAHQPGWKLAFTGPVEVVYTRATAR